MPTLLILTLLACNWEQPDSRHRTGEAGTAPRDSSDPWTAGDGSSGTDGSGGTDGTDPPLEEMRGIWITRWTYVSASDVEAMMADVAAAGFNSVFFQVRGSFDAFYRSDLEPWSPLLTGTVGEDPGWDPLAVAVEAGHAQGLDVHAYINVFPFWRGSAPPAESDPRHAYLDHPAWLVADSSGVPMALNSSYVFASPGNPDVQAHIAAVAADISGAYDVDGVHLDYIRYPGAGYSHDAVSDARFASAGDGLTWAEWQREQVLSTVAGVSDAVEVPVTAAVWGVYENRWGWSGVSQGNLDYYQDSRAFLSEGLLDATIPMIYWPVAEAPGDRLDFRTLVADHVSGAAGRHVYAGFGGESVTTDQALDCVRAAREEGAWGVVLFDYSLFAADLHRFRDEVFQDDAAPPRMSWR
jgi:uncharacterized lipoprotein YddW (UPF0748 family)